MDAFVKFLDAEAAKAKALPADDLGALAAFVRAFSATTGQRIGPAPAHVKANVKACFVAFGWDVAANKALPGTAPPTPEKIGAFVESVRAALSKPAPPPAPGAAADAPPPPPPPAHVNVTPTREELADLSLACDRLWSLDVNRLSPGADYKIDLQQGTGPYVSGDHAPNPLFVGVRPAAIQGPTWKRFMALLDNYERGTGVTEVVTRQELAEDAAFLDEIMRMPVMKYTLSYLRASRKFSGDEKAFTALLHQKWFEMYSRSHGKLDSSGFEHVFLGEEKDGAVTGFHNWLQMYLEEKAGRFDYLGYIKPRVRGRNPILKPNEEEQLVTIQFAWGEEAKPVSSSFIGTSPEFEMALYSLCFLMGEQENIVQCGPYRAVITCYTQQGYGKSRGKTYIGSSFPGAAPLTKDQAAGKIQSQYRQKEGSQAAHAKRAASRGGGK